LFSVQKIIPREKILSVQFAPNLDSNIGKKSQNLASKWPKVRTSQATLSPQQGALFTHGGGQQTKGFYITPLPATTSRKKGAN